VSFPPISETPPTLSLYQFQFNGYAFGYGSPLKLTKIDGLDLTTIRTGDSPRPRDRGSFVGLDLPAEREVTFEGELHTDGISFGHALLELAKGLRSTGQTELPLYMNHPVYGSLVGLGRVRKRQLPIDITYALGRLAKTTVMLGLSDPTFYGPTVATVIKATVPNATMKFNLAFNFSFGGGSYVATTTINNTGNEECRPRIIFEECNAPRIWNASIEGNPTLAFDLEIPAGAQLVVDTDVHSALYYPPGETEPVDVMSTIVPGSEWWSLPEGVSAISFLSGTGTTKGQAIIESAPAYTL
jgi:hypothetical protein